MKKILTLCILHQDSKVLLGMKKRGFGEGKWNGFGGKVHADETIEEATVREMKEEAGITLHNIKKHGVLHFCFVENESEVLEVHIFRATTYTGKVTESEEMLPKWFSVSDIPYKDMWPDDEYWLPKLLKGKCFTGGFLFGSNDTILENTLKVCTYLDIHKYTLA